LRQRYPPAHKGGHALATVVHTGQALRVEEVTDAWLRTYTRNAEHFALMKEMGLRSYLCVPLTVTGRVLGALTFLSTDAERRYGADDLALAEELGRHAALAIDNARLYGEAQQAVRVRDHFLMSASHDLRTPLTVISGTTALLHRRLERGETPDLAWMHTRLTAVRDAASRMSSTVEEITDAAQLQMGGTLALDVGPLDLGALVRAVAGYVAQAGRGGPAIPLVVDAPEGITIEGDRARLERVVQNIVGNAVKYSPSGTPVEIEVRAVPGAASITVRDRGVGIPADELPRLFTPFFRASTSKGIAGTGIGLAGSKTIVEQHGGHITIDSVVGAGTTVTIALPRTLPVAD
jgi:signal transduction histidine kinase